MSAPTHINPAAEQCQVPGCEYRPCSHFHLTSTDLVGRHFAALAKETSELCSYPGCGLPVSSGVHGACQECIDGGSWRCNDIDCHRFQALPEQLVADIAASLRVLRDRDGVWISDAQIEDRARNIVQVLIINYRITGVSP